MDPQLPMSQKKSSKRPLGQSVNIPLFLSLEDREQIKQYITEFIKPISFKNKEELELLLQQAISKRYCWMKDGQQDKGDSAWDGVSANMLAKDIEKINIGFKECQLSSLIADIFNLKLFQVLEQAAGRGLALPADFFWLWEVVPFRNLQTFLTTLKLKQNYVNQEPEKFTKTLLSLINDNKLQQCCSYYSLFKPMPQFEEKLLIPKLLSTDQIYSPTIIELLRSREELKRKIVQQIDLAKAVIILEHLGEDPRTYENVHKFILRKHYKSMTHEYSEWYIFEDKMCFNQNFIEWYCHERQDLDLAIRQSMMFRNGIQCGIQKELVPNPLYQYDTFSCAETIFHRLEPQQSHDKANKQGQSQTQTQAQQNQSKYLSLHQYGIEEGDVHFINDSSSGEFQKMEMIISSSKQVGFDAEYRCTSTKYEQLGVALIQMAAHNQIFLIDFIALEADPKFIHFFTALLSNPDLIIVGHSVQSDIKFIERTMKISVLEGVVDISKIFKEKFPNETQTSLAFMTSFMIGKQLSKYEQRSNWNRRPLKKTQVHYAALDAQVCLVIYGLLKEQQIKLTEAVIKSKQKTINNLIRKENIVYLKHQQAMLTDERPRFLVDNMLKKLCSLLRNLGIDAEFMSVSNYELMQDTAKKEGRIIITKDKKLLSKKSPAMPVYCIAEKGDSDLMLEELRRQFNLNLNLFKPLSRCVKCNCPDLEVIPPEEALKYLNFEYEDTNVQQFWQCVKCKQIYWEGNQFKNAKKKFTGMSEQST